MNSSSVSNPKNNTSMEPKGKGIVPNKNVVCFKCHGHGHGHYKNDCPNNRAFTMQEGNEIRERLE